MGLPTPSFRPTTFNASWHLGQCPRAWLTAVVVLLSLSACHSPDRFETRLDLAKSLATAEIHLEPTLLDLGTVEARAFLGSGWSWNERSGGTSFVWGTGEISELRFFLSTARELDLEVRCFPHSFQGSPTQEVRPTLNGIPLEPLILAPKPQVYRIHVPADASRQGTNRLTFRYGYSHSPATASSGRGKRSLAVGWDWIRFHLEPSAARSEVTASAAGISMPFGTGVDFYFEADRGDRLAFDEILVPGDSAAGVEIRLLTDDSLATALLDLHTSQREFAIDLPISEKQAVRLSMRAAALAGDPDPILLLGPRIETTGTRKGAPEASAKALASLPPAERPNVLVYVVDTMRADHLGLYGYPRNVSPEIDQFGDGAIVFDHAIAQTSWTKPAVASIFTGLRATAHGVNHRQHRLASRFRTMAELLSDASYRTVAFTTNAYFSADSGLQQGFDEFNLQPARADSVNQKIFDWLDRNGQEGPFFLYVHTIDPHAPYDPPENYRREFAPEVRDPDAGSFEHIRGLAFGEIPRTPQTEQDLVDLYDAEIAFADQQFGLLLENLRARGLYDEMLVVFASDHGEGFYEHGIQGHGWDLYGEAIQVPLILKPPRTSSGKRVPELAQQIDLLPTLLELVGIEVPKMLRGRSLVPHLSDESLPETDQISVFSYMDYEGREGMSVIRGQWKLIEPLSTGFGRSRELYQRLHDPDERLDLAAEYPVLAGYLATLIRQQLLELEQLPEVESLEFDEETRQQLKALGYLQ